MKAKERERLLDVLKARFEQNLQRHPGVTWADVRARLEDDLDALQSLEKWSRPAVSRM